MPSRATYPRNRYSIHLLFYFYDKSTNTDAELAVGELAKLAEPKAHSADARMKTPMLHTLLERREFLLAEMQEKLRAAREEVVLLHE